MSSIYYALQRADFERKAAQGMDATGLSEPSAAPGVDALPSIKAEVSTENIALLSWKPIPPA